MSETKRTPKERAAEFVGALRRARNDRGKLAALRRGLTDNPRMHVAARCCCRVVDAVLIRGMVDAVLY